jgi:hypothetical protein
VFTPTSQALGNATKHFQLILSDVERSLEDLHDQVHSLQTSSVATLTTSVLSNKGTDPRPPLSMSGTFPSSFQGVASPLSTRKRQTSFMSVNSDGGAGERGNGDSLFQSATAGNATFSNKIWKTKGILSFNLIRLRNKFMEIFLDIGKSSNIYTMNSYSYLLQQQAFITYNHTIHQRFDTSTYPSMKKPVLETIREMESNKEIEPLDEDHFIPSLNASNRSTTVQLKDYSSLYELSEHLSSRYLEKKTPQEITSSFKQPVTGTTTTKSPDSAATTPSQSGRLGKKTSKSSLLNYSTYNYHRRTSFLSTLPRVLQSTFLYSYEFFHSTFYFSFRSVKALFSSFYQLIFGSNELLSNTTVYESLNKDISLLEGADNEVSLGRKLEVTKRMRRSYRMFTPIR